MRVPAGAKELGASWHWDSLPPFPLSLLGSFLGKSFILKNIQRKKYHLCFPYRKSNGFYFSVPLSSFC